MRIFQTDIDTLFRQLLPTFLRKPLIIAFFEAATKPLIWLQQKLNISRNDNLYNLSITPQICFLEKALNDRFDKYPRRIYISDGKQLQQIYVFQNAEQLPTFVFLDGETDEDENAYNILPLFLQNETGGFVDGISFKIHVPSALTLNFDEVKSFVNQYKLVGKTCEVLISL